MTHVTNPVTKNEQERPITEEWLIVEGLMTTLDEQGQVNLSPMGPQVNRAQTEFILRPYKTSRTYRNLKRTGQGVFHITDDVLLIAQAAIGQVPAPPPYISLPDVPVRVLADACRWMALEVTAMDDSQERTTIECRVSQQGELRPFWGFNRAKHAVLEAAILATRVHLLPRLEILVALERLTSAVQKTAGNQEHDAFNLLSQYIRQQPATSSAEAPSG